MIQKIRKFIVIGLASFTLLSPAAAVPLVGGIASADIQNSLCQGADAASQANSGQGACASTSGDTGAGGIKGIAQRVTNVFSIIVGAAAIIMIIYGGFRYITSGGDSGKVGNAKNTLIYAIIGLVIVALAQLIVRFVISQANTSTSNF